MKLKEIRFILENCDYITINGKYIGDFLIDDIKTSIQRIACNAIEEMTTANTIAIEIHKDANKIHYQFNQLDSEEMKLTVFERLSGNDITSIQFELVNDNENPVSKKFHYYVDWTGDNDYVNEAQTTYLSNNENLYITISDGKDVSDFFDLEEIDDPDFMDLKFDMYDVGDKYSNSDRYNVEREGEE